MDTASSSFSAADADDAAGKETPIVWCPEQQIYVGGTVPGATNEDIEEMLQSSNGMLHIFGYGSLCWHPGKQGEAVLADPEVASTLGHILGYHRVWGQKSTDHRGTVRFPGVVCTLLTSSEFQMIRGTQQEEEVISGKEGKIFATKGRIYMIPPHLALACLEELDFREKGGYSREIVNVVQEGDSGQALRALLYRGTPDNPAFSTKLVTDLRYAAAVIAVAVGPSGPNSVYLHQLNHFLKQAVSHEQNPQYRSTNLGNDDSIKEQQRQPEDDTCILSDMVTALQPHTLYFYCGAGSNQHGQLLNYLPPTDHDFSSLTQSFVACFGADQENKEDVIPEQLYCGGGHSGLLTQSGHLYMWGWNDHGQCGPRPKDYPTSTGSIHQDPTTTTTTTTVDQNGLKLPVPLLKPLSIQAEMASLGFSHTLVIEKGTGKLYAFGDDSHGQVTGRIVTSTNTTSVADAVVTMPVIPQVVDENDKFVSVAAGLFHSAAITTNGELLTFGNSKHGQCCVGSNNSNNNSKKWKPWDGSNLIQVVCGRHHTAVLDQRGRIWTLGDNKFGQLGRSIPSQSTRSFSADGHQYNDDDADAFTKKGKKHFLVDPIPQLVDGPLGREHGEEHGETVSSSSSSDDYRCVELHSGWSHIVALVQQGPTNEDNRGYRISSSQTSNNRRTIVFGWGRNDKGQLGKLDHKETSSSNMVYVPTRLEMPWEKEDDNDVQVSSTSSFPSSNRKIVTSVTCGSESSYFLVRKEDGLSTAQSSSSSSPWFDIYSVGWNEHGNLGLGNDDDDEENVLVVSKIPGATLSSQLVVGNPQEMLLTNARTDCIVDETYGYDQRSRQRVLLAAGGAHLIVMKTIL